MSRKTLIHKKATFLKITEFSLGEKFAYFFHSSPTQTLDIVVKKDLFKTDLEFSKIYHLLLFINPIGCLIFGIMLLFYGLKNDLEIKYFGLFLLLIFFLFLLYYFIKIRKYGQVELKFGEYSRFIYLTKAEYFDFKQKFNSIMNDEKA